MVVVAMLFCRRRQPPWGAVVLAGWLLTAGLRRYWEPATAATRDAGYPSPAAAAPQTALGMWLVAALPVCAMRVLYRTAADDPLTLAILVACQGRRLTRVTAAV